MKETIIIGRPNVRCNCIDFYAMQDGNSYYIFSRKFRGALYSHFKNGVPVRKLFDFKSAYGDETIINTIVQMRSFLRYAEKEYDVQLLRERSAGGSRRPKARISKLDYEWEGGEIA